MKPGMTIVELATEVQRQAEAKKDYVVATKALSMSENATLRFGGTEVAIGDTCHDQLATFLSMPRQYYDRCLQQAPDLLAANVNTWLHKQDDNKRMLRTLDGKARALLSPRYRQMENDGMLQAVLPAIAPLDLAIMSCNISETKLFLKLVDKKVARELAKHGAKFGDGGHTIVRCLSPAATLSNSEVGLGSMNVLTGTYDSFCSNLASFGERSMRKHHVGARHDIGDELYALLSDETRKVTDEALWRQVADVVKAAFDPSRFDELVGKIEGTRDDKIDDPIEVIELSSKRFGFNEDEGKNILKHLIEGADLSRFGLHNAITRASQDVADYDRATMFERAGGTVIELPRSEWTELAKAA